MRPVQSSGAPRCGGGDGVVGGGTVGRCTSPAGRDARCLDVDDGPGRVRSARRRSHPARLRLAHRRVSSLLRGRVVVVVVDVVSRLVLVLRRRSRNSHDRRLRTRQSGQLSTDSTAAVSS